MNWTPPENYLLPSGAWVEHKAAHKCKFIVQFHYPTTMLISHHGFEALDRVQTGRAVAIFHIKPKKQ